MGKYCTNCGNELLPGARFCVNCGVPVGSTPAPPDKVPESAEPLFESGPIKEPEPAPAPKDRSFPAPLDRNLTERPINTKQTKNVLPVILSVLLALQVVVVALFGWPGYFFGNESQVKFAETQIKDGVAEAEGIRIDFKNSPNLQSFGLATTEKADINEGTVSDTYEFEFAAIPQENIVISMPAPAGFAVSADELLYLDVGVAVTGDTGEIFMVHDFIEAEIVNGMFTAELTPSAYSTPEQTVYTSGAAIDKRTYTDKFRFNAAYTTKTWKDSASGHFKLIFDSAYTKSSMKDEDVALILSRMEQVYTQMKDFGFDMSSRTSWPMKIYTKRFSPNKETNVETAGLYVMKLWGINYSHIEINRNLFINLDSAQISAVFAHEFTHFLYNCKVPLGKQLAWLNEGMAVFFEDYFGGRPEYSARYLAVFDGIYPASDSDEAGYARPSLINYWSVKNDWLGGIDSLSGKHKMSGLLDLLSTGGYVRVGQWHDWITTCLGSPSKYAVDFYKKVVLRDASVWGDKGGHPPYQLHSAITAPKKELKTWDQVKNFFGQYTEMDILADIKNKFYEMKLLSAELGTEHGQTMEVKVPAFGATLVALNMSAKEQEKQKEDMTLEVFDAGPAELVLFRARGSQVETIEGDRLLAPDFIKYLQDQNRYLLLVVNPTAEVLTVELTVREQVKGTEMPKELSVFNSLGIPGGAMDNNYLTTVSVNSMPDGSFVIEIPELTWSFRFSDGSENVCNASAFKLSGKAYPYTEGQMTREAEDAYAAMADRAGEVILHGNLDKTMQKVKVTKKENSRRQQRTNDEVWTITGGFFFSYPKANGKVQYVFYVNHDITGTETTIYYDSNNQVDHTDVTDDVSAERRRNTPILLIDD